ncbi:MAG: hypothetical protein D4R50_02590 [Actinomycetales bacterium]|nr:MAG: hypothetical protein D4R50_02590 [Actinomycetales bacterium]
MLADGHIHLFENGYKKSGENEISLYEDLIKQHTIKSSLVVGYEGESWALGNNAYISALALTRPWMHPLAFFKPSNLQVSELENYLELGFEGITLYIFSDAEVAELGAIDKSVWAWLIDHKWMVSVNSKGSYWNVWLDVLHEWPELTLLISHLGLPRVDADHLTKDDIASELSTIYRLHSYANVYLKLSGFYALEQEDPIYPYPSLRDYLQYIVNNFDRTRLIWGSDFTPALSAVTFPQTFEHLFQLDFLQQNDIEKILYQNMMQLLTNLAK